MNKKLIAIAVATVMAAPVAMADLKITGRISNDFTSISEESSTAANAEDATASRREIGDNGQNRVEFTFSEGKTFGKYAMAVSSESAATSGIREQYVGYNFGSVKVAIGRVAGAAKNLESDPLIASFLQLRSSFAEARTSKEYGSSSFISNIVEASGKSGGMSWKVQLDPTDNTGGTTPGGANEGHVGLGVKGKAGAVNWWAGYNNGIGSDGGSSNDNVNTKVGASMKFGKIKGTLNISSADDGTNTWTATALSADMGMGNGASIHATIAATTGDVEGTMTRVAYSNKLNKAATAYAGVRVDDPDAGDATTTIGGGMVIKF